MDECTHIHKYVHMNALCAYVCVCVYKDLPFWLDSRFVSFILASMTDELSSPTLFSVIFVDSRWATLRNHQSKKIPTDDEPTVSVPNWMDGVLFSFTFESVSMSRFVISSYFLSDLCQAYIVYAR